MTTSHLTLRASTVKQTKNVTEKPREYSGRKYVPIEAAPSIKLTEGHDCKQIYPDNSQDKAQRRFFHHYIRYVITEVLGTFIFRGKTRLQCGRSSCQCESAHFAASPTIHDKKMVEVLDLLDNQIEMTPTKVNYLVQRLAIESPEKRQFLALNAAKQKSYIEGKILPEDYHSSFNQTAFELQLSGTIEGSVVTNDFDQAIEIPIRKIEDRYCSKINEKKITAQKAIEKTYPAICNVMQISVQNLKERKQQLKTYFELEKVLDAIEEDFLTTGKVADIEKYFTTAQLLLDTYKEILERKKYCTNYDTKRFQEHTHRLDFFWLRAFVKTYARLESDDQDTKIQAFKDHMNAIKKKPMLEPFKAIITTKSMLKEAESQLLGITSIGECHIANLSTLIFGIVKVKEGSLERCAPEEDELKNQVLEMTKKESAASHNVPKHKVSHKRPLVHGEEQGNQKKIKITP